MIGKTNVLPALNKLIGYVEKENYLGYDPYDTLNSFINFNLLGKFGSVSVTQFQKRNPINIRPLIGIQKEYNPKGIGLFLKAYCKLYKKTGNKSFIEKARLIFNWLNSNYSKGYSGMAWGYNFPWASSSEYKAAYLPSVVVTAHIVDGIFDYFILTKDKSARQAIVSAAEYVSKDIPVTNYDTGISFAYTHHSNGACYNASLHAAEILLKACLVQGKSPDQRIAQATKFVLSMQKSDGSWYYSFDPKKNTERKQIDFHQGFVLISLHNIQQQSGYLRGEIFRAIKKGIEFYRQKQFTSDGRSLWRIPKKWPVDIHNQSQGIITFALLKDYHPDYLKFAKIVATWTINNMQDKSGYFHYRKYPVFSNKIPYMRWSQAWMMLALSELFAVKEE